MSIGKTYTPPVVRLPEVTLQGKGKLILTQELMDQIDYLHNKVGGIEWCGILFYTKESGEIHNPEGFVLKAQQIYPMNIGSETYTEAQIAGLDIIDMYEKIPNAENMKQGLIHTHHRMATFFSGTDMSELHDNVGLHNYYLSLIVNFDGKYTAKIAYEAEVTNKSILVFNNSEDKSQTVASETTKKVMVMMDLDIVKPVFQEVVPEYFQDRYLFLEEEKKKARTFVSGLSSYGSENKWKDGWESMDGKQGKLFDSDKKGLGTAEKKAAELQKVQKGSGKLVNEEGKFISVGEQEMRGLIVDWLNLGLDIDSAMLPEGKFTSIDDGLVFFEKFYKYRTKDETDWFLSEMQKMTLTVFRDYSVKLIQNRGTKILEGWTDHNEIAVDLHNILSTLQQYHLVIGQNEETEKVVTKLY